MARIWRHRAAIGTGLSLLLGLALAPAHADDKGLKDQTYLYDRPVFAIDPGMLLARSGGKRSMQAIASR